MASMNIFEEILARRGLEAATAYAQAAKLLPAMLRAERLQVEAEREKTEFRRSYENPTQTPKVLGKTERERQNGAKKRREENRARRRLQNQMRSRNSGGGKKNK